MPEITGKGRDQNKTGKDAMLQSNPASNKVKKDKSSSLGNNNINHNEKVKNGFEKVLR